MEIVKTIGSYLASLLLKSGADVSLVCRGEHLKAIQTKGLLMQSKETNEEYFCKPIASDNPNDLGKHDFIIVTLKAHSAAQTAKSLIPLMDKHTTVLSAVNGLPWWYFYKTEDKYENTKLISVDPHNSQWKLIKPERALGCVVYPAAEIKNKVLALIAAGFLRHDFLSIVTGNKEQIPPIIN